MIWKIINEFPDYMINENGIIFKIKEASEYAVNNFNASYSSLVKYHKNKDLKIIIN